MTNICFFCKHFQENINGLGHRETAKCKLTGRHTNENNVCDDYSPVSNEFMDYTNEEYEQFGY